jgi:N-acyl-L-homoserine lactone synthetase
VFRYRIAEHGTDDLQSWHELRTGEYLRSGLITPDEIDPESGLFTDKYDEYSTHVLAANDAGQDVGCIRMIEPSDTGTLPVTDLYDIDPLPRSWESSANVVLPEYRKSLVKLGFFRALWALAEEKEFEAMYGIVELPYLDALRKATGLPIEVVSDTRFVFNAPNVATLITRRSMVAAIESDSDDAPVFANYFRKPFDWTLSDDDLAPASR